MADRRLAFHASPPAGHWINDPNGLVHVDGAYRLFAQHRADGPAFRQTGWARFTSPDLLHWTFDGSVIPPHGSEWAYSGCIERTESGLEALHTAHDFRFEHQVRRTSTDAGLTWSEAEHVSDLGQPAANRRDPYIFRDGDEWALLLAEPCDWTDWPGQPASRLRMYRSPDRRLWREAGAIGPWRPSGIMWEVPLLARLDGHDVLIVSEVDRRDGGATCAVRAWIGKLEDASFVRLPGQADEGQLVDHGPDFYALMASVESDWPLQERAFVGWLSNWQTARAMPWPDFCGGPISLPRVLGVDVSRPVPHLVCRPLSDVADRFTRRVGEIPHAGRGRLQVVGDRLALSVEAGAAMVRLDIDWVGGKVVLERMGDLAWRGESAFHPLARASRQVEVYVDGPVIEFFLIDDGVSASIALETTDAPFTVSAQVDGKSAALSWDTVA